MEDWSDPYPFVRMCAARVFQLHVATKPGKSYCESCLPAYFQECLKRGFAIAYIHQPARPIDQNTIDSAMAILAEVLT